MKRITRHRLFNYRAFLLVAAYLLIVVTHLFFAPHFHQGDMQNQALKKNTEFIFNLIRTDRCLINDSKKSDQAAKLLLATSVSNFIKLDRESVIHIGNYFDYQHISNYHFSWLSNRVLRI